MGLREFAKRLSQPRFRWLDRDNLFKWGEPLFCRMRLQRDLWRRLVVMLGVWLLASGVMSLVMAGNKHKPHFLLAIALGGVFGLGPAAMILLMRRKLASGLIIVRPDAILRQRSSSGSDTETTRWPFSSIDRCVLLPAAEISQRFSVMLLTCKEETGLIGVPAKIPLMDVARVLVEKGVRVTKGKTVPAQYLRPLDLRLTWGSLIAGSMLFIIGLVGFVIVRSDQRGADQRVAGAQVVQPVVPQLNPDRVRATPTPPQPPVFAQKNRGDAAPKNPFESGSLPVTPTQDPAGLPPNATPGSRVDSGMSSPSLNENPFASPKRPRMPTVPVPAHVKTTRFIGGDEGVPIPSTSPSREPLIGLWCTFDTAARPTKCTRIMPLFVRVPVGAPGECEFAREGYAVGALNVRASDRVTAVQIVFMRLGTDGKLDPADSYTSSWMGAPSNDPVETTSGEGAKVIGVCARDTAELITSVALVLD